MNKQYFHQFSHQQFFFFKKFRFLCSHLQIIISKCHDQTKNLLDLAVSNCLVLNILLLNIISSKKSNIIYFISIVIFKLFNKKIFDLFIEVLAELLLKQSINSKYVRMPLTILQVKVNLCYFAVMQNFFK